MKAIVSATTTLTVPFFDCDPMAVCWHGHYVKYFELARCTLFKKINYDYAGMKASGYAWPVIDLNIRYIQPLHYDQEFEIEAGITEYENYLQIKYIVKNIEGNEKLTRGSTRQVAVTIDTFEMQLISPKILAAKLAKYL